MCSIHFGRLAINRQLLSVFLAFLFGFVGSVLGNEPPDLSKLTESEKQQGFGQFQTTEPEKKPPPKHEEAPEAIRRRRAEEDRRRREQNRIHRQAMAGVGAGSTAAGGLVLGKSFHNNYNVSNSTWDPLSGNQTFGSHDPLAETDSEIVHDSSQSNVSRTSESSPLDFRMVRSHSISASVNSFFYRDLSRLNEPIVNGVNSSQLGWSGAPGIEGQFEWQPSVENDGVQMGFAIAQGLDEATAIGVNRLFTTPAIGFSTSPFRSQREMSFATVEGNLLLAGMPYKSAIGIRWLHLRDGLENQVLPAGHTHRINTISDSLVAQFMIQPSVEWERVKLESLFQVGAGAFHGTSSTQIERIVGGPIDAPFDIQAGRTTGTLFFKGQIGVAIPVQKWFAFRGGIQLLAVTETAQAAGQMKSTDFVQQKYHLRTESLALGSLYAGIEMRR